MRSRLKWILWASSGAISVGMLFSGENQQSLIQDVCAGVADEGCPATSDPTVHTGSTLDGYADDTNGGIVFDDAKAALTLQKEGGLFKNTTFSLSSSTVAVCSADFDNDGWVDIVGADQPGRELVLYKNRTYENQVAPNLPDWDDLDYVTTPKFAADYGYIENAGIFCNTAQPGHLPPPNCIAGVSGLSCEDYNRDGNQDFIIFRGGNTDWNQLTRPHRADIFLGNGNGTFQQRTQIMANLNVMDKMGVEMQILPLDYNGDGVMDFMIGGSTHPDNTFRTYDDYNNSNGGSVKVYFGRNTNNDPGVAPKFDLGVTLVSNAQMGMNGVTGIAFKDFDGDGFKDLIATGPNKNSGSNRTKIHYYSGVPGGGVAVNPTDISDTYPGGGALILGDDFSLDGYPDLVVASDNNRGHNGKGGVARYWKNNRTSTPFSDGIDQNLTENNAPYGDYDTGISIQYDNDPDGTPDIIIADGNHAAGYTVLANRAVPQFAECGTVQSGLLDLGPLTTTEMVVTATRISPDMTLPAGTSITFFMSNETPIDWHEASPCVDDLNDYCVTFPSSVGRDIRWKAEMCSSADKTKTPEIKGIDITYDYTEAKEHYRAGVVTNDGVAYVGAFRQPGNRGHFYANNAGLTKTYWDFAASLDAMPDASRNVYTANVAGDTRLDFTVANAENLKATLGSSALQAAAVVAWQRSARFGIGGVTPVSRLGSVETSTPAVISPPQVPVWYPKADNATKQKVDQFILEHADRKTIVLFGSKDGAIHAVRSDVSDMDNSGDIPDGSGKEAWAFIPSRVANGMLFDYTNSSATSYPDGSPTVADVILNDGNIHTVAIIAGGKGHKGIFALDITETIDEETNAVLGPTPLWHVDPNGGTALALSKPAIARVKVGVTETFYAIIARGTEILAVDISTGATAWQFQTKCTVTSDIITFETEDVGEAGSPELDSFTDRAAWADQCGYVYKVNPAQNTGTYIQGIGPIDIGDTDPAGNARTALFSTVDTDCALGSQSPITGTLGGRTDSTDRFTLFFGSGGLEDFTPTVDNAFYAVYANTGEIRGCAAGAEEKGVIRGDCTGAGLNRVCEKFYGGVVITASEVIITKASDPSVGTATCDFGSAEIASFGIADFSTGFEIATSSATVSSLYGDGGALYFTTLSGDLVKIGNARAENAGDDSINGTGGGQADGDDSSNESSMTGWRIVE